MVLYNSFLDQNLIYSVSLSLELINYYLLILFVKGHAQHIGKRDTDIEEEKEAITEVTRLLEDNGVISSENEEADIDVTTKTFSVAATEATANPKPLFEPVEDLAFTISEDTPVSSTMKFN